MDNNPASRTTYIVVGALTVLVGLVPLLAMIGVLPHGQHEPADPAPSWMGWVIGLMFVGAGIIVIARGVWGASQSDDQLPPTVPWPLRAINDVLAIGIVLGLAALFTWVAFGPGPRHFSMNIEGLIFAGSKSGETIGRVAFGLFAILGWAIAALTVRATLRRWRR
ncbi:MAG TPA: hypothetical protein VLV55_06980 [Rhizomicrobium sp.]|nr:hypothetical protein [Rhizomicrobium sp.]